MTDIALLLGDDAWSADIAVLGGGLATDDGLQTSIRMSLFTDARARPDDILPHEGGDPRGYWGDAFNADPNDRTGSRLWLLERAKLTEATRIRAQGIVTEALAWLIEDGVVRSLEVEIALVRSSAQRPSGAIGIGINLTRPEGPARERYDFVWEATARSLAA